MILIDVFNDDLLHYGKENIYICRKDKTIFSYLNKEKLFESVKFWLLGHFLTQTGEGICYASFTKEVSLPGPGPRHGEV